MWVEDKEYNYLIPGDILLFSVRKPSWSQRLIISAQSCFYHAKEAHPNITHAAIYVGKYKTKNACVAHIVRDGYIIEPLNSYIYNHSTAESQKFRPFYVFRAIDPTFSAKIVEVALSPQKTAQTFFWSIPKAAACLNPFKSRNPQRQDNLRSRHSSKSFCARFTIETLQISANTLKSNAYFPTVRANSSTRSLLSYLIASEMYTHSVILDMDPFETIKHSIESHFNKSKKSTKTNVTTYAVIMLGELNESLDNCKKIENSFVTSKDISETSHKLSNKKLRVKRTKMIHKIMKDEQKKFITLQFRPKKDEFKEPQCCSLESINEISPKWIDCVEL